MRKTRLKYFLGLILVSLYFLSYSYHVQCASSLKLSKKLSPEIVPETVLETVPETAQKLSQKLSQILSQKFYTWSRSFFNNFLVAPLYRTISFK